jgi:tetratricopeptide (TPR) repeat protein
MRTGDRDIMPLQWGRVIEGDESGVDELGGGVTVYGGEPARKPPGAALERGQEIGRYVILERLGAGGMGVVYSAYDPQLDRKVALKLLLPWRRRGREDHEEHGTRLLREAQAMARLAHPNVITVHDVGTAGDRVFIAMEFVDGNTLTQWSKAKHGWEEVLDTFLRAGRGLAAAHKAGLIHRDFKPDNVLVGDDGRVRVLDFGLARPTTADEGLDSQNDGPRPSDEEGLSAAHSVLSTELTRTGARVGTPAYMSPEQHLGEPLDAASDQFSYCVALYEGLYGKRPFQATNAQALAFLVSQGKFNEPPSDADAPAWLWRVIRKGLSVDSHERWSSMERLLTELSRDPRKERRRVGVWVSAAAVLLIGSGAAVFGRGDPGEICAGSEARLQGVWDDGMKAAVGESFAATGLSYADDSRRGVEGQLDGYAAAWVSMHKDACEATHLRGEQSQEMLDLRMECLTERLEELGALTKVLAEADDKVVAEAVKAGSALSPIDACANREALRSRMKPPDDLQTAKAVAGIRSRLMTVKALELAGRYPDALPLATSIHAEASETGYGPVMVETSYRLGRLHNLSGSFEDAGEALEACYFGAAEIGYDPIAQACAREQVDVVGYRGANLEMGKMWFRLGEVALDRGEVGPGERAWLHDNLGMAHFRAAEFDTAYAQFERGLELREGIHGPQHADVASSLNHVGAVRVKQERFAEARELFERALAIREALQGEDHPSVASILNNLGIVSRNMERYDDAIGYYERTLELRKRSVGERHPGVAESLVNLGVTYNSRGDVEAAGKAHAQAVEILEEVYGPDHPDVGSALTNLGAVQYRQEKVAEARVTWERALRAIEGHYDQHPDAAGLHISLGKADMEEGKFDAALQRYERARATFVAVYGKDHPKVSLTDQQIGDAQFARGRTEEAVTAYESSLSILEKGAPLPSALAEVRFSLAEALWARNKGRGEDRKRARALSSKAAEALSELPVEEHGTLAATVRAWVETHP